MARSKRIHLQREAPNINGFVVPMHELELPYTMLDTDKRESWNIHHHYFTARNLGRFTLTQLLRDLDSSQTPLPKDVHAIYHDRYSPPSLPSLIDIMDRIDQAYQTQEPLRLGTISFPTYRIISDEQMHQAHMEFNELNS